MNKQRILAWLAVAIVIVGLIFFVSRGQASIIDHDTTFDQSYSIGSGSTVVVKNNAKITVNGDLSIDGILKCDGGPIRVVVSGNATIHSNVECNRPALSGSDDVGTGIIFIVKGSVTFDKNASIVSNGNVQVVSDEGKILTTQAQIDAVYDDVAKDEGSGPRIGPFVSNHATTNIKASAFNAIKNEEIGSVNADSNIAFVNVAHAQTPTDKNGNAVDNVIISGTWHIGDGSTPPGGLQIPKPPKDVHKIVVNFDFGAQGKITLKDFDLVGPPGRDGDDDSNKNCVAHGSAGENAFRMKVVAADIDIDNFRLELGNGGKGGDAETKKDCDPGVAYGGAGGEAGNFKMMAMGSIQIASFHIVPGRGGDGGNATASGKDGTDACPGTKGGDATATGGDGGKNKKELAATGAVSGIGNITIDEVTGGYGGTAFANPGKGGNGNACKCAGGTGGKGTATGGKGGDASAVIVGGTGTANGGNGGDADSHGGQGGSGGSCPLKPSGGNGGKGGDASSKEGQGGSGTSSNGDPGNIKDETGGNGGNGGDGCGPGNGGKGGTGKPNGNDGSPGKKACPDEEQHHTMGGTGSDVNVNGGTSVGSGVTGGGGTTSGGTTSGGSGTTETKKTVKAIKYNGKYIPISQLIQEGDHGPGGCRAIHWHAAIGTIPQTTDGTRVPDPGPLCGYGKVSDVQVLDVQASASANLQVQVQGL